MKNYSNFKASIKVVSGIQSGFDDKDIPLMESHSIMTDNDGKRLDQDLETIYGELDTIKEQLDGSGGTGGADGKSAYQIWLEAGNEGTVDDFLESLKGEKGDSALVPTHGQVAFMVENGDLYVYIPQNSANPYEIGEDGNLYMTVPKITNTVG